MDGIELIQGKISIWLPKKIWTSAMTHYERMDIEDRGGSDANYPRFSEDQFFDMGMLEILYNFSLKLFWTVKSPDMLVGFFKQWKWMAYWKVRIKIMMAMSIILNFRKPKKSGMLKLRIKPKTQTAVIEAVAKKR